MSFANLGKIFKIKKKHEKIGRGEVSLPIEGFEQCVQLMLAYLGKHGSEFSIVENCKCDKSETPTAHMGTHGTTVLRYIGRCYGLAGADPFEDLEIDQIVDIFNDFISKLLLLGKEDKSLKAKEVKKLKAQALDFLTKFDAIIVANGGHLALNKLTWADFLLVGMWDYIREVLQIDLKQFANIEKAVRNITSIRRTSVPA